MNFKQVQAIERIISLRNPNTKLVVQYDNNIVSGDFSTTGSRAKLTNAFNDDQSFAYAAVKEFGKSNIYIPNEPLSVENLERIIMFMLNFESTRDGYYPAIYNVNFLDTKIELPFLRLEPDTNFEIISILRDED